MFNETEKTCQYVYFHDVLPTKTCLEQSKSERLWLEPRLIVIGFNAA